MTDKRILAGIIMRTFTFVVIKNITKVTHCLKTLRIGEEIYIYI
jgi:hypothetical protein